MAHNVVSPYRLKVQEAFKRHKTPLNIGVEMPTIEAIKLFVASGNGVALVPGIAVAPELKRGELVAVAVKEFKLERKLRICLPQKWTALPCGTGIFAGGGVNQQNP